MPSGLVLMSPWVDLTMSCGSWDENAALDVVPRPEADGKLMFLACQTPRHTMHMSFSAGIVLAMHIAT